MDDMVVVGHWTAAMLRSSTPLLMVTLGETLTQRVGIINLGVEGQMLGGACAGFAVGRRYRRSDARFHRGRRCGRFAVRGARFPVSWFAEPTRSAAASRCGRWDWASRPTSAARSSAAM